MCWVVHLFLNFFEFSFQRNVSIMKKLTILSLLLIVCVFSRLEAQNIVQIKNRFRANNYIQLEGQKLKSGLLGANKSNSEWTIEQIDKEFFRIKKTGTNLYLHTEKTKIECSSVPAGYFTSHWKKVAVGGKYFRIENRFRKGQVLHVESALASSAVPAGYFTSHWEFVEVAKASLPLESYNSTGVWKPSDNMRGWHWDGKVASYPEEVNGKTELIIRNFDGKNFGGVTKRIPFSNSDNIRGWHWLDGKVASYLYVKGGRTVLNMCMFDGNKLEQCREIPFSNSDNIKSWYWEGNKVVYHAMVGQTIIVHSRTFDGYKFGEATTSVFPDVNIRSWSKVNNVVSYHTYRGGKTQLVIENQTAESKISFPGTYQQMTVDQLRLELEKNGDFKLVTTDKLRPNECALVFANANADDISADFGLLMCATKLGDNVELRSELIYGGCDASNPLNEGLGAKCEVGVASNDLKIEFPGGESNFNIQGPAASACGAASSEMVCANAGATLASGGFQVSDDKGSGFGLALEAGIGAGLSGGYEDGILSASLNLKFIAGASISFSINLEDAGEKIIKAGEDAVIIVGGEIVKGANTVAKVLEQGGKEVVEWSQNAFDGKKLSRALAKGEGYLSVFNQAGYVTRIVVVYAHNGQLKTETKDISAGFTAEFFIPPGSVGITLRVEGIATIDKDVLVRSFAKADGLEKAYKFWGTIFDVVYAEVPTKR